MEELNEKSLERVVSQKAFQMGSSFPCQICVVGFLGGVGLTYFLLGVIMSLGGVAFPHFPVGISTVNFSQLDIDDVGGDCGSVKYREKSTILEMDKKVSSLYKSWNDSLSTSTSHKTHKSIPNAPHLENCKLSAKLNQRLDNCSSNMGFPAWTIWKGMLDDLSFSTDEELKHYRNSIISEGDYPPWISGSDMENYPLTRKVQRDIWLLQHPINCRDTSLKFLVTDWERLPGFGIGAQIAGMSGLLAIAINEKRVLVTDYYNRADHQGCKGSSRSSWSCYFFSETSQECRKRAFELMQDKVALEKGIITTKNNYTSKEIWTGKIPRNWGNPWSFLQPTTEINGSLLVHHRKMDRRWWRAQAVRYLMRFQSEYTCKLMNIARHAAFGRDAAKTVLSASSKEDTEDVQENNKRGLENFVWSNEKPWIPHPMLSMHVRMGDKACEMEVVEFEDYMHLAERIRKCFPHINTIWLSTEMQDVIDKSKTYSNWNFYYTDVARQKRNITMATYEASLGREISTNYPIVNFLMATEADFFIGALGSTWCFLIDGMRNTGGKVMSGYLSVNKDRFW